MGGGIPKKKKKKTIFFFFFFFLEFRKLGAVFFCTVFQFSKIRGGQWRTTKQLVFLVFFVLFFVFLPYCLSDTLLLVKKNKSQPCRFLTKISNIVQYQKIVLAAILKWNLFFLCYFSNENLFMFSYSEPNFIKKIPLGKVVFQILAKIEMQNKNWLFGRHFETIQHLICFCRILFCIVHTCLVQIFIAKFRWGSGLLGGSMEPPLGTNKSENTLVTYVFKQSISQMSTQGNCATEGNSGNCQSGNCHSGERWMRKPSVHGGK